MATDGSLPADNAVGENREGAQREEHRHREAGSQPLSEPRSRGASPSAFAGELVEEAEAIVKNHREGKISRSEAVGQLFIVFDLAGSPPDLDARRASFQQLCADIETEAEREEEAGERGRRITEARLFRDLGIGGGAGEDRASFEDFFADLGRFIRKRPHADDEEDIIDDISFAGGKRARLDRRRLPWNERENAGSAVTANPGGVENRRLLQLFSLNPSSVVSDIRLSGAAPPFPATEWSNIVKGLSVNLDNVLAGLHHVNPPRQSVASLGQCEITFDAPKSSKTVQTASDWLSTWTASTRAYVFVFSHRREELEAYGEYIMQLFAAKVASAAPKVILYDKAVRDLVAGGQRLSLTDIGAYSHLKEAILAADGVEAQGHSSNSGGAKGRGARGSGGRDQIWPVGATGGMASASSSTSASLAAERGTAPVHVKVEEAKKRSWVQRFLRWNCWGLPVPVSVSDWSITARPLPSPPDSVLNDAVAASTISNNPHLFALPSPVNVERLRDLSSTHPNQAFVLSVIEGFQNGFWPLANPPADAPCIVNHSNPSPSDPVHASFLLEQRDIELDKGRYSEGFPELLPGMRAMPLRVVPKDGGSALRLVVNHSKDPHSLNSMVDRALMPKVPLDNMRSLGEHILTMREEHPGEELVLWKSDVSEAYRLLPVHFFWQLMQAEWIAGLFYLNHCVVFGGRASQYMFIAFMSIVSWIAVHIRGIRFLCSFSDDHFGVALRCDTTWYEPFATLLPTPQVKLLRLWDDLGIPHKKRKQVSGSPLVIIGILVDVNRFTLTLPKESITELLDELALWCDPKGKIASWGAPLRRWQQLAGWLNWSFNVFPLLRPCLSNVYAKMRGKSSNGGVFRPNNAIRADLGWAMAYIRRSTGVHILSSLHWLPSEANYTIYCDASLKGMGFWVVNENRGFYSPTVDTQGEDFIFFHESLCVLSAIIWLDEHECLPQRLTIYTDNTNTVDMFNTLSASPRMNPILMSACDIALTGLLDFKVLFVPGCDNQVADALSRFDVSRVVFTTDKPRIEGGQSLSYPAIILSLARIRIRIRILTDF